MVVDVEGATERRDFPWGWIGAEGLEQPLPAARRSYRGRPLHAARRSCRGCPLSAAAGAARGRESCHAQGLEHGALEFAGKRVTGRGREGAAPNPKLAPWRATGTRGEGSESGQGW